MISKVLCFTTSYNRPKMLRSCIQDIHNQTYSNIFHSINIAYDIKDDYSYLYNDIDKNLKVVYNKNSHQQINHINAIEAVQYKEFDLFIKIDDDDIYKKDYVKNIVDYFNTHEVDIVSSKIHIMLNGHTLYEGLFDNLGANPEGSNYCMPMTFAFNRKALDIIMPINDLTSYEDKL